MNLVPYIGKSRARLQEVEAAIAAFDFSAGEQKAYQALNREYQQLRRLMQAWDEQQKSLRELADNQAMLEGDEDEEFREIIAADIAALQGRIANLDRDIKALILPPHPNEGRNTIVEIRPAAGGDEAALFAGDLYRMYLRFAEAKGWKVEELELAETAIGGIKGVAFTLQGDEVWGLMRYESGVHRVQRIPVTESGGRIHTSTVTVAVLAEAEDVDVQINNEDIRVDVFRSSGPGGQSVNTTDSAVRVTHVPTGLSVASQQEKSQHRNREIAMRILRSRLLEIKQLEEEQKNAAERRSQVGTGERSERIRTYNFPQNRITDHRYALTLYDLTNVMEGQLDELLGEIRGRDAERRLELELTAQ